MSDIHNLSYVFPQSIIVKKVKELLPEITTCEKNTIIINIGENNFIYKFKFEKHKDKITKIMKWRILSMDKTPLYTYEELMDRNNGR